VILSDCVSDIDSSDCESNTEVIIRPTSLLIMANSSVSNNIVTNPTPSVNQYQVYSSPPPNLYAQPSLPAPIVPGIRTPQSVVTPNPLGSNSLITDSDIVCIGNYVHSLMLEDFKAMFNHHTATLKDEIKSLRLENKDLRQKLDDLEQYGRRPLVRFSGIPENGKDEDTTSLVLDVASKANLDLSPDNIDLSHRVEKSVSS